MPSRLKRYQTSGHDHLITFSCYQRRPYLNTSQARDLFERSLEQTRLRYRVTVHAYAVMPEHVHLLLSESEELSSPKLSAPSRHPSASSYHDFNVFSTDNVIEKRRYIHRNPVARGLVEKPEDWPHYS